MTGAAASARTSRTSGSRRTNAAASRPLVPTALEAANRHHLMDIRGFTLRAPHRLITSENKYFEKLTTVAAFVFVYRHFDPPVKHSDKKTNKNNISEGNVQLNKIAVMDSIGSASIPRQFSKSCFMLPAPRSQSPPGQPPSTAETLFHGAR